MHLTYPRNALPHSPAVSDDSEAAGAPVAEIEITPAMIAAGTEVLYRHGEAGLQMDEVTVFAIFKAMVGASPKLRDWRVVES